MKAIIAIVRRIAHLAPTAAGQLEGAAEGAHGRHQRHRHRRRDDEVGQRDDRRRCRG